MQTRPMPYASAIAGSSLQVVICALLKKPHIHWAMSDIHSYSIITHHMPGKAPDSDTPSKKRSTKNWTLFFTADTTNSSRQQQPQQPW